MEGDQAGKVGGRQVGEHGQRREGDGPAGPAGAAVEGEGRSDPEHRLQHDEGQRHGRDHPIPVAGGLVELVEVVGPFDARGRPPLGPLEAPALHRVGLVHVDEVEDRRCDVHQGHQARAAGAGRLQQAGFDAGRPEGRHGELRPTGAVVGRHHEHGVAVRIDRREQRGDERVGVAQRGAPHRHLLVGRGGWSVPVGPHQVRALDEHDAARPPTTPRTRRGPKGWVADAERRLGIVLEERASTSRLPARCRPRRSEPCPPHGRRSAPGPVRGHRRSR